MTTEQSGASFNRIIDWCAENGSDFEAVKRAVRQIFRELYFYLPRSVRQDFAEIGFDAEREQIKGKPRRPSPRPPRPSGARRRRRSRRERGQSATELCGCAHRAINHILVPFGARADQPQPSNLGPKNSPGAHFGPALWASYSAQPRTSQRLLPKARMVAVKGGQYGNKSGLAGSVHSTR